MFKCRTIRRLVRGKAFDTETLNKAKTAIDEYVEKGASADLPRVRWGGVEHQGVPVDKEGYAPRRARLVPEDFVKFGYTENCKGCIWLQDGVGGRQGHSE